MKFDFVIDLPVFLKDFELWVALANEAKKLIEIGLVNFDVIKNQTLATLIITELLTNSPQNRLTEKNSQERHLNTRETSKHAQYYSVKNS